MKTLTVKANNRTYTGTAEQIARELVGKDAHPALLADTVREVEYHGEEVEDDTPEYRVVKQEWDMPCDHYACDSVHRHLYNERYDKPQLVEIYDLQGNYRGVESRTMWHSKQRVQWAVVGRDGFAVEVFDTRREARAHADRLTA